MNERPQRFGLQAWLVAAFVAVGTIASLAVMLVVLPSLESSIRTEQARRTGVDVLRELRAQFPRRQVILGTVVMFLFLAWSIAAMVYYSVRDRR